MNTNYCQQINASLGQQFMCSDVNGFTRIRTPFLYPDGDVIDVFLKDRDGILSVSDMGEGLNWLRMQTPAKRRSPKQNKLVEDVRKTLGLELFKGALVARVRPGEDLTPVVIRVAEGSLRLSDLWFTMRTRTVESTSEEVEDYLKDWNVNYEVRPKLLGRSGRTWQPDFFTRTPSQSSLVCVLSTGNKATAKKVTEHVVTTWVDLSHLTTEQEPKKFVSVFDDTSDVWGREDFNLLEGLSEVTFLSKPEEVRAALAA
ncbi:MAG TPA: DUF1828 domain-containing protein [Flavobacteriales bacterium]|nr:DUF1828 domain-containing protein [Flavobacteriales bacterium]HNU57684.1 DUF1828 domain-containing protein [Flavobacteriales bacterium]